MLSGLDYIVLAAYLVVIASIGLAVGRGQRSTRDYFLAGNRAPWWAAGLSIIATEASALTFIGAPIQSLRGDWTYVQLVVGSSLARFAVAGLLIGVYYRAEVVTVYDYLAERFGTVSRNLAAGLFFVGRMLGSGVRLYGAAIALVIVADLPFPLAIAAIAAVAAFYTILGGLRSVIWTDSVQAILLFGGALLALVYLYRDAGLDAGAIVSTLKDATTAAGHSKLRMLDLSLDPRVAYTLAAGVVGSAFLTMSIHGTDQDMMQRALACREAQAGRKSLILSAVLVVPIAVLFLAVGSLLWIHYGGDAGAAAAAGEIAAAKGLGAPAKGFDFLFPLYVVRELPGGIRGLILAALFATAMSSLDSAISALSTTAVRCVWQPYVQPGRDDSHYLKVARALAFGFALLLVGVALFVWLSEGAGGERQGFGVLMLGLKVLTWVFPPLLGVFLVGVLTSRGTDSGNLLAVSIGIGLLLAVEFWGGLVGGEPPFAWTWNPLVGCAVTFAVAAAFRGRAGAVAGPR
ncbi:MAG: hypothetical protein ACE5GX_14710 [Thermoanaerobaculia bacterium]